MPYSVKVLIIIAAVAVVSFFVAELVIPERGEVTANEDAIGEQPSQADDDSSGEDIPAAVAAPQPNQAADAKATKTAKAEPMDAKAAKTSDAKVGKAEPADAKAAKAVDAKTATAPPQKTAAPEAPAVAPPPPPQKKTGLPYRIEQAALCTDIKDRAPQGITNKFSKDAPSVYYFTHLVGARDSTTVVHRWYQNGKLVQTSILSVKSNYWRTHSKRNLLIHTGDVSGQWRVDVVEPGSNTVMESASFTIE